MANVVVSAAVTINVALYSQYRRSLILIVVLITEYNGLLTLYSRT